MPSLRGYEVRTHQLPGDREIDILRRPEEPSQVWVSAQQLAELTGDGRRATGRYSTSDLAYSLSREYVRRERDPHRLYSRSRIRSTTLFSVEGLIQKTCHTTRTSYLSLGLDFIEHVLPDYEDCAERNAELIMAWREALDHIDVVCHGPGEGGFKAAVRARDARLTDGAAAGRPMLVVGTMACEQVLRHSNEPGAGFYLTSPPLDSAMPPALFAVAELHAAQELAGDFRAGARDAPPIATQLVFRLPDDSVILRDGTTILLAPTAAAGPQPGPTAEDVRQAMRTLLRDELPAIVEPIVRKVVQAGSPQTPLAELVGTMTGAVERLAEIALVNREQLELSRQSIELITPSHQMFATASDYIEMDGVADALKRAPALAEPSLGLVHCPNHGKASLWMKRLCREENSKVISNAVARLVAKAAGLEEPPLYIPQYRMRRLEREHAKVLMFNPACWARLKQVFLPVGTPTLLFPGTIKEA
jgi:hypothetical protein